MLYTIHDIIDPHYAQNPIFNLLISYRTGDLPGLHQNDTYTNTQQCTDWHLSPDITLHNDNFHSLNIAQVLIDWGFKQPA